jgi:formylglycine-generating enzyme required for sulfatase activity
MWKEYRQSLSVPGKGVKLPKDPGWGYLDDHPVVNVSWADIMQAGGFCDWASSKAGFKLTLPSDAQWEYAARGGVDGLTYPWGDDFDESKLWCGARRTAPVDRTNKIYRNHYGLTDIVGNVTQWCSDPYNVDYRPVGRDPKDMNENDKFCVRGGGYNNRKTDGVLQNDFRDGYPFDFKGEAFGFRLSAGEK